MSLYYKQLTSLIFESLENEYFDNYDFEIRRPLKKIRYKNLIENILTQSIKLLSENLLLTVLHKNHYWKNIKSYEYLYDKLSDERSKKILLELLAYKILGYVKFKLSLNNIYYWRLREFTSKLKMHDQIKVDFRNGFLDLYDLSRINFDIKLYYVSTGIVNDFLLEQYKYRDIVSVCKGDIVIDAGGCWGDTALYFAAMGADKIYSFEFIPSNINIIQKNLKLNEKYQHTIKIISKPVWDKSDVKMSYLDKGPASIVDHVNRYKDKILTLSIDDLVSNENIDRVDFIKMDIEGAESKALKGASNTIKRYKPKLAISAYHKHDDLYRLPEQILSLRSDYKLYLDYYTIIGDEIILYAM